MPAKIVSTREFQETCLSLISEVERTHEPVIITDHGRAVARLMPSGEDVRDSRKTGRALVIGGLKGSVLRYDDPFAPAADASDWEAMR